MEEIIAGEISIDCRSHGQTHNRKPGFSLFGTDHDCCFKQLNINTELGHRSYCVTDMKETFTILFCNTSHPL